MWSKCSDWIIVRHCVCVCVCVWDPSDYFIKQSIIFYACGGIEMQFLSLVFELPTRPVLMATDGPRSSTYSFCCLLIYAALLKHYSVFYGVAGTGAKNLYISKSIWNFRSWMYILQWSCLSYLMWTYRMSVWNSCEWSTIKPVYQL